MRRSIEQWRMTVPKSVVAGSAAQAMYCIADAKADIIQLFEALEYLMSEVDDDIDLDYNPHARPLAIARAAIEKATSHE